MHLRERQRDTAGGWEDVLGVGSLSCWNEIMRNRILEKIKSRCQDRSIHLRSISEGDEEKEK